MENVDISELLSALGGLATAVVVLGVVISRFTKGDGDDKFFARLAKAIGLKKSE